MSQTASLALQTTFAINALPAMFKVELPVFTVLHHVQPAMQIILVPHACHPTTQLLAPTELALFAIFPIVATAAPPILVYALTVVPHTLSILPAECAN
jgi:hypothetical protein